MDPLIGSALIGAAASGVSTVANGFMQQRAAAYNQAMLERNTAANYMYSQRAQRNAARNEVEGLRAAGLSPVFADGSAAASVASGSAGTANAPQFDPANLLLFAQIKNLDAQTQKTKNEAEKIQAEENNISLAYSHAKDLDATLAKNMPILFDEMSKDSRYSEQMRKLFASAAEDIRKEGVTSGGLQGLEKYLNLRIDTKEALVREMSSRFDWNMAIAKLDDPYVIKSLVKMPQAQRENLLALSGKYIQEVATLAQTAETEVAKRNEIGARIIKINREAAKILHSDNAQMHKEGDTQGLLWSLGGSLAGAAKDVSIASMKIK